MRGWCVGNYLLLGKTYLSLFIYHKPSIVFTNTLPLFNHHKTQPSHEVSPSQIVVVLRAYSKHIVVVLRACSKYIVVVLRACSKYIVAVLRACSKYI